MSVSLGTIRVTWWPGWWRCLAPVGGWTHQQRRFLSLAALEALNLSTVPCVFTAAALFWQQSCI